MSKLTRIVLVRHGETTGESSVRYHGASDIALSDEGRAQMRAAAKQMLRECFDLVVASPMRRSWEAAAIVSGGSPVRLEADFREIDFGRWEGLTKEEIHARDPELAAQWGEQGLAFDFPGGETREAFKQRTLAGLERLQASGASRALVVAHKGTVRTIVETLTGETFGADEPPLGAVIGISRGADGTWRVGRRSSDPAGLEAA